jgi:hypothetical protein
MDKKIPAHIRNHLIRQKRSKLTIKAYCQKNGIHVNTFYGWRHRYEKRVFKASESDTSPSPVSFVSLGTFNTEQIRRNALFDIRFPEGISISVHPGATVEQVQPFFEMIKGGNASC